MGRYDNITVGDLLTEKEVERENRVVYNDSLFVAKTPLTNENEEPIFKVINPYDFVAGAMRVIGEDHHMGHQGLLYYSSTVLEIPGGETWYIYSITPPDLMVHMKSRGVQLSSADGANQPARIRTKLYNDSEASGGTEIPIRNTNDNIPTTSKYKHFNLGSTPPTVLGNDLDRGDFMAVEVGSEGKTVENLENLLKRDNTYVLSIENLVSNVKARVQMKWMFYESSIE